MYSYVVPLSSPAAESAGFLMPNPPQAFLLKMDPTEQKRATLTGGPNSCYSNYCSSLALSCLSLCTFNIYGFPIRPLNLSGGDKGLKWGAHLFIYLFICSCNKSKTREPLHKQQAVIFVNDLYQTHKIIISAEEVSAASFPEGRKEFASFTKDSKTA